MIDRRRFLFFGGAALVCAPAIVRPDILMPIRRVIIPARYPGEIDLLNERDIAYWVVKLGDELTAAWMPDPHMFLEEDPLAHVRPSIEPRSA